jgi:eukaryotic-like serine/threonine-protein kinase
VKDDSAAASPLPVDPARDGGRYTLRSLLGRGGMGEVYLAHDERLRRRVAIKRIRSAGGDELHLRARLEQEARLLAQLGHPAIVQVFDIFEDADGAWIVMELIEGRSLAAVRDAEPASVDDVLSHGIAIAAALEAAHRQGIVHRDLKVENVMLSSSGQIKILDFGLAKRLLPSESTPSLSREGQVLGTVRAMSPEQARGLSVDERSDLFSLGVLLYELLSGTSPFAGASALDTLVRVSTHRQTSLVELPGMAEVVPRALSELVDELLEKAPEQRPASAAKVRARLQVIAESRPRPAGAHGTPLAEPDAEDEPARRRWADLDTAPTEVPAAATAPLKPRRPPVRRRRVLLAALGAAAAAAVAVTVAVLGTRAGPSAADGAAPHAAPASRPAADPSAASAPARDPKGEYERGMALLRSFHRAGAIDEAAGIFQRLLREDDRSAAAYAGLARAYWRRYTFTDVSRDEMFLQQARAAADRAVALDEFLVDARVSHGLVALELGQLDRAEIDMRAALGLDGKSADAHEAMARLYKRRQRPDEMESELRTAIELAPKAHHLYDDLGDLLMQRGRYQEAIALFEKSISLAPDSPYGYSNLGAVYLLQGRYDEAAQRFQDALKIRPSPSLYSNLGTVLFAQGLYGPAASAFERSLAMGGAAHDPLHWANLADAYRQLPDATKAREHYDHAIQLIEADLVRLPRDLTLLSRRALYLAKRGDCPGADKGLASLIDAGDLLPYAMFRMAVTLEICGHRARAISMIERALARGFSSAEIGNDPELRALRADPAYLRMMYRRGKASLGSSVSPAPGSSSPSSPR